MGGQVLFEGQDLRAKWAVTAAAGDANYLPKPLSSLDPRMKTMP